MTSMHTSLLSIFPAVLLASAAGLPLFAAATLLVRGLRKIAVAVLVPFSALPALSLALLTSSGADLVVDGVSLPWMLTGVRLGMDGTSRVFLLLTSILWTIAALYARQYLEKDQARHRFFLFFLLTMGGNIGLVLAQDMVGFYLFFALMTFAAYGLVIHTGSPQAFHAGRIYIMMAVIGEALVIAGMLLAASASGGSTALRDIPGAVAASENRDLIIALVLSGFGVKAGAVPLHMWLPLAHPVAPTPASAVLSGAMIKAGLLGWLRFLPLGMVSLPDWGALCMIAGLSAAFYGVIIGLTQEDPKTILAYSSVSQMGAVTTCVGVALAEPAAWQAGLLAVLLYSLHHGLSKGALFLGTGVAAGAWKDGNGRFVAAGLLLPALALAGAPFTSGAVAKMSIKETAALAPGVWPSLVGWLLPASAVGTTLLMGRFLFLVWAGGAKTAGPGPAFPGRILPWILLLACVAAAGWLSPIVAGRDAGRLRLSWPDLAASLGPILAGVLLMIGVWLIGRQRAVLSRPRIPAGDLIELIVPVFRRLPEGWRSLLPVFTSVKTRATFTIRRIGTLSISAAFAGADDVLARWPSAGVVFLLLGAALLVLFAAQG